MEPNEGLSHSYIALDIAARLRGSQGSKRLLWTILGASSMGLAIWSMHFIGMLAMSMPMTMTYDPFLDLFAKLAQ
jgi:diguanylate cyclase